MKGIFDVINVPAGSFSSEEMAAVGKEIDGKNWSKVSELALSFRNDCELCGDPELSSIWTYFYVVATLRSSLDQVELHIEELKKFNHRGLGKKAARIAEAIEAGFK